MCAEGTRSPPPQFQRVSRCLRLARFSPYEPHRGHRPRRRRREEAQEARSSWPRPRRPRSCSSRSGLSRLKPAAPTVEKSAIWMDTVKRGPMLRQVRGPGHARARGDPLHLGRDRRPRRAARDPAGRAGHSRTRSCSSCRTPSSSATRSTPSRSCARRRPSSSTCARSPTGRSWTSRPPPRPSRSDFHQAELQAATNEGLYKEGLIAELTVKLSRVRAEELATRNAIEEQRVASVADAAKAQVAVQEAHVEQLKRPRRA